MASFFLLGDFEINHLNFYFLASNSIFPYISQPRRLTSHSKALTGNIFWSLLISDMISGNLTATVSNHYLGFYLPLIFFQALIIINQVLLKEIGQNLIKKTSDKVTLIKIGLMSFNLPNKTWISL